MEINQIITNKKTGKAAVICDDVQGEMLLIKYLKDGKPWGPLRDVQAKNFKC